MIRSILRAFVKLFRRRRKRVTFKPYGESVFVARQLDHIRNSLYEIRYPELKSRALIPLPQPRPKFCTCTYPELVQWQDHATCGRCRELIDNARVDELLS